MAVVGAGALVGCSLSTGHSQSNKQSITAIERRELIRRAHVWTPTDVAAMDIRTGPAAHGFDPDAIVACEFSPKEFGGALSWDGTELFFGSTRGGNSDIYVAVRERHPRN